MQRYIGFDWDLEHWCVSLPETKVNAISELIDTWTEPDARFTTHDASSLHGKLVHTSCIFALIRPFLRSISQFAGSFRSPMAKLHSPPSLTADLNWIRNIIAASPNTMPLVHQEPIDINWWGDASSSFGIGLIMGNRWGVWRWANGFEVGPKRRFDIG